MVDPYKLARAETLAKALFSQDLCGRALLNPKDFWLVSNACYNELIGYKLFFSVRLQWHLQDKDELVTCLVGHHEGIPEGMYVLVSKDFPYERSLPSDAAPVPLPV